MWFQRHVTRLRLVITGAKRPTFPFSIPLSRDVYRQRAYAINFSTKGGSTATAVDYVAGGSCIGAPSALGSTLKVRKKAVALFLLGLFAKLN